jgi:short-subunit dehydrogenase
MEDTKQLAVVTGASSGIGLELAKVFARNHFDLLICAEDPAIQEVALEIARFGVQVEPVQANLADPAGVESLYERLRNRPIDAIALNAGVGVGGDFARQTDLAAELNLIDLNVRSTVHLAKLVLPGMIQRGQGKVLFTSSIAAMMPGTFEAVYSASKAFIQSFSQAIREELKGTGVTVTALQPGPTETNFFHRAGLDGTKVGQMAKDDPAQVAQEGYDALMDGRDYVVAGSFKNRLMSTAGKILPERLGAKAHRKLSEPGSGRKAG